MTASGIPAAATWIRRRGSRERGPCALTLSRTVEAASPAP
jgi:hypothetical protein